MKPKQIRKEFERMRKEIIDPEIRERRKQEADNKKVADEELKDMGL
jgi:hypothetical protein